MSGGSLTEYSGNLPAPPCLGEALRRVILVKYYDLPGNDYIRQDVVFSGTGTSRAYTSVHKGY